VRRDFSLCEREAMTDDEVHYLSASEATRLFKDRKLSPVELMQAVISRAAAVEPAVNAFADCYFDEALMAARKAEAEFMKPHGQVRPLEGLPLAVKDDTAIQGQVSTVGSLWLKDHVEDHTNPSIERLIRAGAIVHARTTCPEFCWPWTCDTRIHGITRNPWNLAMTCGASSGGSGAALAAGSTTLASGTDSLGSIRHPAAMCGVVGYKPPYGRNPESPGNSFDFYNHVGPMTRTVADCVMMQNVMSGPHPLDHATIRPGLLIPAELEDIAGLKIAYSADLGCFPVTSDVRRELIETMNALEATGAQIEELSIDWAEQAVSVAANFGDHLYADEFAKAVRDHPDEVCDYSIHFARQCEEVSEADFHAALKIAGRVWWDHLGPLFQRFDVFICPTVAFHEVPADNRPWDHNITVNGKQYCDHDGVMTGIFNMFSRCPVLAVPSGRTDLGMPTGIQIAGRPFDDIKVFRIAAALEAARPWFDTSERRPDLPDSDNAVVG
jgi:Asp-tRNA(Asn)/Glu-tRNA(Gln) amidotransferase A subunit family amidase